MQTTEHSSSTDPLNGARLMNTLHEFVRLGHRRCGTPVERAAAEYIQRHFQAIGLQDVRLEEFPIHRWDAQNWELKIEATSEQVYSIPCLPMGYSPSTPPDGLHARLCYAGYGTPADFERVKVAGKVAVIESKVILNFQPAYKLFQAEQVAALHGAQALVVLLDAAENLTPAYTEREEQGDLPIPVFLVGREDANMVRYVLHQTDEVQAHLHLEVTLEEATTQDVVGTLPGGEDGYLIIGSHYDSTYSGAVDNAGSNAALLALAEYFAAKPLSQRPKTMLFVAHPGHEISVGARHFINVRQAMLPNVAAYISLDGFGSTGWLFEHDGGAVQTGADEKRGITISSNPLILRLVAEAIRKHRLLPAAYVPAETIVFNPDLEGRFYAAGVPVLMIIGKPLWYHTPLDTPDKCTPDQLERSARAHAEILEGLLQIPTQELRNADRSLSPTDLPALFTPDAEAEAPTLCLHVTPDPLRVGAPGIFYFIDFRDVRHLVVHLEWDFGDGTRASGHFVPYVYSQPGRYTVSVRATNDAGKVGSASRIVWVL